MDEPFFVATIPDNQARIKIELEDVAVDGMVYYRLIYDEVDDYFPSWVQMIPGQLRLMKPPASDSNATQYEDPVLAVDMVGRLIPEDRPTLNDLPEEFSIKIVRVDEEGRAIAQVEKPLNVPVDWERISLSSALVDTTIPPHWSDIQTFTGLNLPHDVALDSNIWLVKLTKADVIELRQHLDREQFYVDRSFTNALCFRDTTPNIDQEISAILMALRLFKSGFLALSIRFWFGEISGHTLFDRYAQRPSYTEYVLHEDELQALVEWVGVFRGLTIHADSLMTRVLSRFERAYTGDLHDRITDTVIGLEALVAPSQEGDITYRVKQRVAFLNSDEPRTRLAING